MPSSSALTASNTNAVTGQPSTRATRSLNSFMAFRSHYSCLFDNLQQKDISGFLTYLWQHDPCKPKWTILAKAYTIIRDHQGKDNTPLDEFLIINAPLINVAAPEDYFEQLGWIVTGVDANIIRRKEAFDIDPGLLATTVSVQDLLNHSYDCGYLDTMDLVQDNGNHTMAMVSLPPANTHAPNLGAVTGSNNSAMNITRHSPAALFPPSPMLAYEPLGQAPWYNADFGKFCTSTEFDPYYGDPFNAYDITAPLDNGCDDLSALFSDLVR